MNYIKSTKAKLEEFIQNKPVKVEISYGSQNQEQDLYFLKQLFEEKSLTDLYDWQNMNNILHKIVFNISDLKVWINKDNKDDDNQSQNLNPKIKQYILQPFDSFLGNTGSSIIHTDNYSVNIDYIPQGRQIHPNPNEMKNSESGKSLSKSQLLSIQQNGTFTTIADGGQLKTWQISESFFTPNQSILKLINELGKPNLSELYCNSHTRERIIKQNYQDSRFDMKYWNLRDGLQTLFFDIPKELLNCLIGIPLFWYYYQGINYYIETILSQENIPQQFQHLTYNSFFQKIVSEFDMQKAMVDAIQQLQWSQILYDELKNIKIHLLAQCLIQFFNQKSLQIFQEIDQFKDEFLSTLIIDYFKKQILKQEDNIDQIKGLMAECQQLLNQYKLRSYERQIANLNIQLAKLSQEQLFKLSSKVIYNKYDNYFYKITNLWKESQLVECLQFLQESIKFTWIYIFNIRDNHNQITAHSLFKQVQQKIQINLQNKENEVNVDHDNSDDEDGIFGGCCVRCTCGSYLLNYFFLYFLTGIILINIISRMIGVFFLFTLIIKLAFLYALFLLIFLVKYLKSILIYNQFVDPEDLNHYQQFPIFKIIFTNSILGIFKILYSLLQIMICFFKYALIKLRILPIYLKNCLTFQMIKILGKIPDRNSSICKLIPKNEEEKQFIGQENLDFKQMPQQNYLSQKIALKFFNIEQIIFFIDQKINNWYYQKLERKLIHQYNSRLEQYKENLQNQLQQLPFPNTHIQDFLDSNMQSFKNKISQILESSYITKCEIQYQEGWRIFYEKQQLQQIYKQIQDHLLQLQSKSPEKLSHLWQKFLVEKGNYQLLAECFLKKMLKQYQIEKKEFDSNLFQMLTRSRQFDQSNQNLHTEINTHLNICYFQEIRLFEKFELNLKHLIQQQIPNLNFNKPIN